LLWCTETYIEVLSSDAEERDNAMEVDETDCKEFKLDSKEGHESWQSVKQQPMDKP
jgi:hypothetical protein